ncbi:dITP/XTP pyrophosphatase [Labeo rohita]|uniref:DITP/XTP pyrophosphatase n=1 Tax=Labeo rohita TaxID=84645 RepID=A0ABQ8L0A0_LABRO|nr:dITP/XTP pyrophosphatase [Labeo rohita]
MRVDIKGETIFRYLSKDIPEYPTPVEFHITEVAHINEADIRAAEERFLEKLLTKEEKTAHPPFLSEFTTSPLFLNKTSRYGNFRFTFPLAELMEAYKKQKCEDQEPVLRIYETKLFSQEIEYVILVHNPEFNEKFRDFPLLKSSPLVAYDGHQIIWKSQAICETHNFQLVTCGKTAMPEPLNSHEWYVWDQVSIVFHTKDVLTIPKRKMKASLSCCELDPKEQHSESTMSLHKEREDEDAALKFDSPTPQPSCDQPMTSDTR